MFCLFFYKIEYRSFLRRMCEMIKNCELLAPAGDMEKLKTAVRFGADAVYFGGSRFNARMSADNFDDAAMEDAIPAYIEGKKRLGVFGAERLQAHCVVYCGNVYVLCGEARFKLHRHFRFPGQAADGR